LKKLGVAHSCRRLVEGKHCWSFRGETGEEGESRIERRKFEHRARKPLLQMSEMEAVEHGDRALQANGPR
jgi:hypothetical protein